MFTIIITQSSNDRRKKEHYSSLTSSTKESMKKAIEILSACEQDFSKHAPKEIVPKIRMWNCQDKLTLFLQGFFLSNIFSPEWAARSSYIRQLSWPKVHTCVAFPSPCIQCVHSVYAHLQASCLEVLGAFAPARRCHCTHLRHLCPSWHPLRFSIVRFFTCCLRIFTSSARLMAVCGVCVPAPRSNLPSLWARIKSYSVFTGIPSSFAAFVDPISCASFTAWTLYSLLYARCFPTFFDRNFDCLTKKWLSFYCLLLFIINTPKVLILRGFQRIYTVF